MKRVFVLTFVQFMDWYCTMDGFWHEAERATPPYPAALEQRWRNLTAVLPDFPQNAVLHPSTKTVRALRQRGRRKVR